MAKPVLSAINVFDSTVGTTAYFKIYVSYTSPDIIAEYEYTIFDGSDENIVCTSSGTSKNLSYSLSNGWGFSISPNEELKNRSSSYYLKIRVKLTSDSDYGEYSSPAVLYCKSKPIIGLSGLTKDSDNIIQMSASVFEMTYTANEEEGETIKTYQYRFYDSKKSILDESQIYYGTINHSFSVYGLEAGKNYYVQGFATTKNGYNLETGLYSIKVSYSVSNSHYAFEAENDRYNASIKLTSHFVSLEGSPNGEISYVQIADNKYAVDLTNGSKVTYFISEQSNNLRGFDLKFIVNRTFYKDIIEIAWNNDTYNVVSHIMMCCRNFTDSTDADKKLYGLMRLECDGENYATIESNHCSINEDDNYFMIDVLYSNNCFELYVTPVDLSSVAHSV